MGSTERSLDERMRDWRARWEETEAVARRRGWKFTPLAIAAPAAEEDLRAIEERHEQAIPGQLRQLLSKGSAEVQFGWKVSRDDTPRGELRNVHSGGIRNLVWSIANIDQAITNFRGWHAYFFGQLGPGDEPEPREQPNHPEMWQHQFAFRELPNGDTLTIDTKDADPTRQPVRYFSHEAEGLHGRAVAPNLSRQARLSRRSLERRSVLPAPRIGARTAFR